MLKNKRQVDTVLVSYTRNPDTEHGLLIVGRKQPNQAIDVVNAIDGPEADDIYKKLITQGA